MFFDAMFVSVPEPGVCSSARELWSRPAPPGPQRRGPGASDGLSTRRPCVVIKRAELNATTARKAGGAAALGQHGQNQDYQLHPHQQWIQEKNPRGT